MTAYNILFIAVDDLRTALGCYGDPNAITPNIDRLAARSMLFQHAYCQQAVCNPSRASLMTGLRPDTIKVWDLKSHFRHEVPDKWVGLPQFTTGTHFRDAKPDTITIPQYFKQNGYHTQSVGKIYHGSPEAQDAVSWSVPETLNVVWKRNDYLLPENQSEETDRWPGYKMSATEAADVEDDAYGDGQVAESALKILNDIKEQPFFLAVGFRKPHLPFSAPQKYWDLYDPDQISFPDNPEKPHGIPNYAWHNAKELRGYNDVPDEGALSDSLIRKLRHGYYACVSYMDAQVGKLLDALEEHSLTDKTVVILWGDHGYHLGEKALWCKTTNYELDTRAPLILSVPDEGTGESRALVEFVDIYPTLLDCCGLPAREGLEGVSLMPLLKQPHREWKRAAFSQFPRPWSYNGEPEVMGYTMRTERYRYTEWIQFRSGRTLARELYDHKDDDVEMSNRANNSVYAHEVKILSKMLRQGWQAALPNSSNLNN